MRPSTTKQMAAGSAPAPLRSPPPDAGGGSSGGPRDPAQTAAGLVETLVPRWADHAVVHLFDEVAAQEPVAQSLAATWSASPYLVVHRVAVAHAPTSVRPDSFLWAGTTQRLPAHNAMLSSLSRGDTVHIAQVDSFTADHLATQLGTPLCAEFLRDCSVLLVPLLAGANVLGNALLVRDPARPPFGEDAVATLGTLARWAASAIDAGRRYERQTRLLHEMRHGLRPDLPPHLGGVDLCRRYLPYCRAAGVGGDWYDAIPLGDGRIALVIGDVGDHGGGAASVMNRCKTLVRTMVLLGLPPDQVLGRFDRHFAELARPARDDQLATCLVVRYDPATRQCQAAGAGHVPPILIGPGGHREVLDVPDGAPIGAGGPGFRARAFATDDGSVLALCTDGFAVLHHTDIDRALTRLSAALPDPGRSAAEICESAFQGIDPEARTDDVTLLVARLLGDQARDGRPPKGLA
ncbi:MAG TPA: SpoIIE family protein phosphatase [Streptosporangiaceae bacterium]|nr:SpoIIE family protein phosphatase [Streptosporangiaceae bacterium]